jgi:hypothetical protein
VLTADAQADQLEQDPEMVAFVAGFCRRHHPDHTRVILLAHVTDLPARIAA